jgi:hypothetical protein
MGERTMVSEAAKEKKVAHSPHPHYPHVALPTRHASWYGTRIAYLRSSPP